MAAIFNMAFMVFSETEKMGSPLDINPGVIFWTTITFILLILLLYKTAWNPILTALNTREQMIKDSLEKATIAKEEAEKMIAENQSNIAKAEEEARKIIAQGREYSEKLKEQILNESKVEAKKIVDAASQEIDRKNREAFGKLKEQIADIAIQAAEKIILENLDKEKQSKIISKYIEDISKNWLWVNLMFQQDTQIL